MQVTRHPLASYFAARVTVVALACCLIGLTPQAAHASNQPSSTRAPGLIDAQKGGPRAASVTVTPLGDLAYTLSPAGPLEQTADPSVRVTVRGSEWRLYVMWDCAPAVASAYIRETHAAGGWMRVGPAPVLVASSTGKRCVHSRKDGVTVIDFSLRLQLGADGEDPWTVNPGAYPGRIRFVLETAEGDRRDRVGPGSGAPRQGAHGPGFADAADASDMAGEIGHDAHGIGLITASDITAPRSAPDGAREDPQPGERSDEATRTPESPSSAESAPSLADTPRAENEPGRSGIETTATAPAHAGSPVEKVRRTAPRVPKSKPSDPGPVPSEPPTKTLEPDQATVAPPG